MELWVRSQDKENLIKTINQIGLYYSDKKMIIANYQPDFIGTQGEYYEKLGVYKSKERALEVLDEIQNMIKPTLINTEYHSEIKQDTDKISFDVVMTPIEDKITYIQPNVVVYEMPKE